MGVNYERRLIPEGMDSGFLGVIMKEDGE